MTINRSSSVELERMQRRAERARLGRARMVIQVQGKVSALLEVISESAEPEPKSKP